MNVAQAIARYASVAEWAAGLRERWGGDPLAEESDKLASLEAFCAFIEKDPDALAAFCILRRKATGDRFVSRKRRDTVKQQLAAYHAEAGLTGTPARRHRSDVVSFLLYNGVEM